MNFIVHPEAESEFYEAVTYFDEKVEGLGTEFAREVFSTISRITSLPLAWTVLSDNFHRCLCKRFPYGLIYEIIDEENLTILAIANIQAANRITGKPDWHDRRMYTILKPHVFLLALLYLTLPIVGQHKPEVDLRVNGIGSGTTYSTIIKNIGNPSRTRNRDIDECGEGGKLRYLYYPGLTLEVLSDPKGSNFKVISMEVLSTKWTITPGLTTGAKKQDVRSKFGSPLQNELRENKFVYVTKDNLGLVRFEFKGNKLVKVSMNETLC